MTLEQNFQRRAAVHNRMGKAPAFRQRAAVVPPKAPDPTPAKPEPTGTSTKPAAATTPTKPTVTPDPKPNTTSEKSTSSAGPPPSKATTSSLPSTTSAAPPTSTSSTSVIPSTTSSLPSATSHSSTTSRALPTTTPRLVAPTSAAQADATHSAAPTTTSGLGTMTLVGIIFGSLIGVAIVCVVIAFIIRHVRKKRTAVDAFDSAKFRRSAVMLDEKDQEPDFRPRPPTMIERRQGTPAPASGGANSFLPPPTMAYPYSDLAQSAAVPPAPPAMYAAASPQYGTLPPPPPPPSQANAYGAIPGAYGVPAPGAFGAQYDQAGYGAPPIPGTYAPGAYATYGATSDPRYPYHYQQQQGYPQYSNSNLASYQQQPAVAYGPRMDSLPSSMSNSALVEKQALRAAEESSAAQNIGAGMMSTSSSSASSSSSSSGGSSLTRQPTQLGGAPPAYVDENGDGVKLAAKSDVKVKPVVMSPPGLGGSKASGTNLAFASAASSSKSTRPVSAYSSYSLYGDDDAYGGI